MTADAAPRTLAEEVRTPRAAGIAGIAFAIVMATVVVLMRLAAPLAGHNTQWLTHDTQRTQVTIAVSLIPYAGIAFMWFIGVIRTRIGAQEDRLFATVFLGSGLLFVAMLFAGGAVMGAVLTMYSTQHSLSDDQAHMAAALSSVLLTTFGIRMAALFTMIATNLGRRTKIIPKWLIVFGFVVGLLMMFAPIGNRWAILIFPLWVFVLSVQIILASGRAVPAAVTPETSA